MPARDHLHHGDGALGGDRPAGHYRGQLLVLEPGEEQIQRNEQDHERLLKLPSVIVHLCKI